MNYAAIYLVFLYILLPHFSLAWLLPPCPLPKCSTSPIVSSTVPALYVPGCPNRQFRSEPKTPDSLLSTERGYILEDLNDIWIEPIAHCINCTVKNPFLFFISAKYRACSSISLAIVEFVEIAVNFSWCRIYRWRSVTIDHYVVLLKYIRLLTVRFALTSAGYLMVIYIYIHYNPIPMFHCRYRSVDYATPQVLLYCKHANRMGLYKFFELYIIQNGVAESILCFFVSWSCIWRLQFTQVYNI